MELAFTILDQFSFECRKVIGFALSMPPDWLKNSRHFFILSEVKPKPIMPCSHAFFHTLPQLPVITSSIDWFTVLSVSLVIGYSNYLGFGEKLP